MWRVLLIQGGNMNHLGKRQPELYGTTTAAELDALLMAEAARLEVALEIHYTNLEGEAMNRVYQASADGKALGSVHVAPGRRAQYLGRGRRARRR